MVKKEKRIYHISVLLIHAFCHNAVPNSLFSVFLLSLSLFYDFTGRCAFEDLILNVVLQRITADFLLTPTDKVK